MAEKRGKKRPYISISSSEDDDDEEEHQSEEESESGSGPEPESELEEDSNDDDDEEEEEDTSVSTDDGEDDEESANEWSDEEGDESDALDGEGSSDLENDESFCNSVIRVLQEKSDVQELNLKNCKSYLRRHGLRIAGTKAECIQRIMEHWRIKEGNAEALYPRSSFTINCTGDVCKGDVVLFTQMVYEKFDKVTRRGSFLGKRTVAGRVVKESYGAAKQQHTFTVEILWSKGINKLPPLFPLLVKGRNLYKLKTFRQRWKDETERLKVLAEKHKRGSAARLVRAMNKTRKECSKNGGLKRQKQIHHPRPSRSGKEAEPGRAKRSYGCSKAKKHPQKPPPVRRANSKKNSSKSRPPNSSIFHQNLTHPNRNGDTTTHSYSGAFQNLHRPEMQLHHNQWTAPLHFPRYEAESTSSTLRPPHFRPYMDSSVSYLHHAYSAYSDPIHTFEPRNLNPSPELMNIYGHSSTHNYFSGGGTHLDPSPGLMNMYRLPRTRNYFPGGRMTHMDRGGKGFRDS